MTDDGTDALEQALALSRAPGWLPALRQRSLPKSVLILLRIAAGHEDSIVSSARRTLESERAVADAATLYVQQVLLDERADHYRVLGVNPGADIDTVREHYRWMMRWLHPDRHGERWETVYSERVNAAWNTLRLKERREAYDRQRLNPQSSSTAFAPLSAAKRELLIAERLEPQGRSVLSPWVFRHLPKLVLSGLAAMALVVVGLVLWTEPAPLPDAIASTTADGPRNDHGKVRDVATPRALADTRRATESPRTAASSSVRTAGVMATPAAESPARATAEPASTGNSAISAAVASARLVVGTAPLGGSTAGKAMPAGVAAPVAAATVASTAASLRAKALPQPVANGAGGSMSIARVEPAPAERQMPPLSDARHAAVKGTEAAASVPGASEQGATRPAMVAAVDTPVGGQDPSTDRRPILAVSSAFTAAYGHGDLPEMMNLFTPDAVENRGGVDAIAEDYGSLFRDTSSRELNLEGMKWSVQPTRIIGTGNFEARLWPRSGGAAKQVGGWIQIEAVLIGREWKIKSLLHGNRE